MERQIAVKFIFKDNSIILTKSQRMGLRYAFDNVSRFYPQNDSGYLLQVLQFLADELSGSALPFTVVYRAAQKYCGIDL